jgi:zinc-ribbon domain
MFCPHCGAKLSAEARKCEHCGVALRRRRWPILLALSVLVMALGIGGFLIGKHYLAVARLNERLEEAVGKDSGYTETILKIEAESGSMTYAELFSLCEKSIQDRTNLIIELRGLYPSVDSDLKDALVEHLTSENELIRQKAGFYRKQMAVNTALELYLDELKDPPSSYYGWDYYETRLAKLKSDTSEAMSAMIAEGTEFVKSYEALIQREKSLDEKMNHADLRFVRVFEKHKAQNIAKAKESMDTVRSLKI